MIVVSYHDDLKEVQGDSALAVLLAAPAAAAPFDRLEWWRGLQEECGLNPVIGVARDGSQRVAIAFHRAARDLLTLSNWYTFRVRPIVSPDADAEALLLALASDLAGEAPRISLAGLPDEDGTASSVEKAFRQAGWAVFRSVCDTNHILKAGDRSYADYIESRPGQLRTTLKRKAGKVQVTIESHFDPASWAAYEAVYAQSWKPEEGSPAFLRRFAEAEGAAGRLRLGVARHEGEPVAAQFWTVEAGTAFIHKLAHTEASKPLSPGTTLSAALFEQVIDRDKVELVDFGTGDDPYKRDWMEQVRPRFRLDMYCPGWPGNWLAMGKQAVRRLARREAHG